MWLTLILWFFISWKQITISHFTVLLVYKIDKHKPDWLQCQLYCVNMPFSKSRWCWSGCLVPHLSHQETCWPKKYLDVLDSCENTKHCIKMTGFETHEMTINVQNGVHTSFPKWDCSKKALNNGGNINSQCWSYIPGRTAVHGAEFDFCPETHRCSGRSQGK